MSRIGKEPIAIPEAVTFNVDASNVVSVKGPKGELSVNVDKDLKVSLNDGLATVERPSDQKHHRAAHGLYRALINNMIVGVTEGYKLELELVGVGYKASVSNNVLELNLGYSHITFFQMPEEVKATAEMVKGQNPKVTLESTDKQLIGQVAAKLKSLRKPEPYKGKGIKFVGEEIRRKAGKTAAK